MRYCFNLGSLRAPAVSIRRERGKCSTVLFLVGTQTWENKSKKQKRNERPQSSKLVQSSSVIAFQRKKLPSEPELGSIMSLIRGLAYKKSDLP